MSTAIILGAFAAVLILVYVTGRRHGIQAERSASLAQLAKVQDKIINLNNQIAQNLEQIEREKNAKLKDILGNSASSAVTFWGNVSDSADSKD